MRPLCLLKQNLRGNKNKFQLGINTISSLAPVLQKKFRSNVFMTLFRKTKRDTIIGKTIISYPLIRTGTCTYQGVRILFSENLASFVFLKHPFWDSLFCLKWLTASQLVRKNIDLDLIRRYLVIKTFRNKFSFLNHVIIISKI